MDCNVGSIDKLVRLIIGIGLLLSGVILQNWVGWIGLVLIITGARGRCLIYYMLGLSTAKNNKQDDSV